MLLSEVKTDAQLLTVIEKRVWGLNEILTWAYVHFRAEVKVDLPSTLHVRYSQRKGRPDRRVEIHVPQIRFFDIHRKMMLGEDDG